MQIKVRVLVESAATNVKIYVGSGPRFLTIVRQDVEYVLSREATRELLNRMDGFGSDIRPWGLEIRELLRQSLANKKCDARSKDSRRMAGRRR